MMGRRRDLSIEDVARMVIHKRAPGLLESERNGENSRGRPAVTLPKISILGDYPAWWDEDFARRPVMARHELTCRCGGMHHT